MSQPVTGKTHLGHRLEMSPNGDIYLCEREGDAAKILSISRYWIGSGGYMLPRLDGW